MWETRKESTFGHTVPAAATRSWLSSILFALLIGPAFPLARGQDRPAGFVKEKLDRIPALLKEPWTKTIAGGVALVARHGKVVSLTTVGMQDIEGIVPLTEATIFRIASMSKPITSVAVMILVDDGKLMTVTDPLSKFVPEFKDVKVLVPARDGKSFETVKAAREITIHDLLTHTSGISHRLLNKPFVARMCQAGVSDGLVETPGTVGDNVRSSPSCRWSASRRCLGAGLNTDVLGHVVEQRRASRWSSSAANASSSRSR